MSNNKVELFWKTIDLILWMNEQVTISLHHDDDGPPLMVVIIATEGSVENPPQPELCQKSEFLKNSKSKHQIQAKS